MTLAIRQRTFLDAMIREPIQLAISQPHQVAISTISVSLMAIFFGSSGAVPALAAWAGAIGVEYAYLKGLSDAAYARSAWGGRLVWGAFAIIVIAGISVLLRDAYHVAWMLDPGPWLAVLLAVLHILPLAFIGLCSANLHMEAEGQRVDADRAALERVEARQQEEEQYQASRRRRRAEVEDEIAAERQRRSLEIEAEKQKALAKLEYRTARAQEAAQRPHEAPAPEPHAAAQSPVRAIGKDELIARVRAAHGHSPQFSRAELARETGWSEAMIRKVLKEIQGE
jgi:hypothetical protein